MSRIAPVLVSILLSSAADAQDGDSGAVSVPSAPGLFGSETYVDGTSAPSTDWAGADISGLLFDAADPSGLSANLTSTSPSFLNQVPVSRIGYVDLVNLPFDTPGYNLDFNGLMGPPVSIGRGISNWPDVTIGGQPDLSRFDMLDLLKRIVGPEAAGGAILGLFGNVNYTPGMVPPAINFLRTDTTQNAFARSCQIAVDALLPFKGQYYNSCKSASSADYGQCRAALKSYVQSCLAFAETRQDPIRPDVPPTLPPEILSRMTAVSGILFYVADDPAKSRIYCSAVRISKSWLLTARHCGFRQDQENPGKWFTLNTAEIRFIPFDNPTEQIKVSAPVDPYQVTQTYTYIEEDTSNDYMFFRIDGEEADIALPVEAPMAADRLVLFSFAVTALMDADPSQAVSDDQLVRDGTWTRYMTYDSSRTCLVGAMPRPNCLAYACQAEFVSSGGPLFRISGNDVALVGVHVGHIDPASGDSCANPQLLGLVNRGVAPRTEDLNRLANLD